MKQVENSLLTKRCAISILLILLCYTGLSQNMDTLVLPMRGIDSLLPFSFSQHRYQPSFVEHSQRKMVIQKQDSNYLHLLADYLCYSFVIINKSKKSLTYYLFKNESENNLFVIENVQTKIIDSMFNGIFVPAKNCKLPRYKNHIPISIAPSQTYRCFWLCKNKAKAKKLNQIRISNNIEIIVHPFSLFIKSIFLGVSFFVMMFYSFLYVFAKRNIFFKYSLFVLFLFLHEAVNLGYVFNIFYFIDNFPRLQQALPILFQFCVFACYCLFIYELLEIKKTSVFIYKLCNGWVFFVFANAVIILGIYYFVDSIEFKLKWYAISRFIIYLGILLQFIYFAFFIKGFLKIYFVIGVGIIIFSGILGMYFNDLNIKDNSYIASELPIMTRVGFLFDFIFFGFVLGTFINQANKEKEETQIALIEQLKVNQKMIETQNEILEKKIFERTIEIEKKSIESLDLTISNEVIAAKLTALRAQMNPHFIFNSLNSINSFIVNNQEEKATDYLTSFSRLIRLILENSKSEFITIEQEITTLKKYVELEYMRFNGKFNYSFVVPDDIIESNIMIPPLLIQPFIENAIWHGLMHLDDIIGELTITMFKISSDFVIEILDNGVGMQKSHEFKKDSQTHKHSFGMSLIEERIKLIEKKDKLVISTRIEEAYPSKENKGTKITIKINNYK